MKKLLLILLFASPAWATTYYVDETASMASDSNTGLSPTYTSGTTGPWLTIGKCASTIAAGDTCTVLPGGSYDEIVAETTDGTMGSPITYVATGSPRAIVRAFKVTSADYIIIDGFEITATGMGVGASVCFSGVTPQVCITGTAPTGDQLINNNIHDTAVSAILMGNTVNNIIRGNTITTVPFGNIAIATAGTNSGMLIENNTLSFTPDYISPVGTKFVIRNNTFGPANPAETQHMDAVQMSATATFSLIEGNISVDNASIDNHFFLDQQTSSDNWIIRYNTIYKSKGGFLLTGAKQIKLYNNTIANANTYTTSNFQLSYADYLSRTSTVVARNNIWYNSSTGSCTTPDTCIYAKGVGSSTIDKDYDNRYLSGDPLETHQLNSDPLFTDAANGDFTLQGGSPSIDAGGSLTLVATADTGSGTTLVVDDAGVFQDGWAGADPDVIAVGTVGNTATISSIDYVTNTITLASGITRNDGDSIWLYSKSDGVIVLNGTAPDLGSNESGGSVTLASVSPSSGAEGATVSVTLTGTAFNGGNAAVSISGTGVTVSNVVVVNSITITADFTIAASATVGSRNVTVMTDDGTSNTRTFTVTCVSASLAFSSQPVSTALGSSLGSVQVQVQCGDSSVNTGSSASIVLAKDGSATWNALTSTSNPTLTKSATSGTATWTDLKVTPTPGVGSITAASSGLTGATSNSITITSTPITPTRGVRARMRAH